MFQQSINNRSKTIYQSPNNPVTIVQQLFNSHLTLHFGADQRCGKFNSLSTQTSYEICSVENYVC